jgi:hypothetical protein
MSPPIADACKLAETAAQRTGLLPLWEKVAAKRSDEGYAWRFR